MRFVKVDTCFKKMHIGQIASCKVGEKIGLIFGLSQINVVNGHATFRDKIFVFEKNDQFVLDKGTMVTFLSYEHKRINTVTNVIALTALDSFKDHRGVYRENQTYHDDNAWNHIVNGIPYADFEEGRLCVIILPIIQNDIVYIYKGVLSGNEHLAYEIFHELRYKTDNRWKDYTDIALFIQKSVEYIESLNIDNIISDYTVYRVERLQRRPGHDDHYFIHKISNLKTDDPYLNYLLPSIDELISYDNNWCSSCDEDNSGEYYLKEETLTAQKAAKRNYTKYNHLAFLIMDEITRSKEEYERIYTLNNKMDKIFATDKKKNLIDWSKNLPNNIIEIVDSYNNTK